MLASDVALDDSKGMCQFLAQAALTCLDHPEQRTVHFGALPSVSRLLDMYRHNAFEDDQPPGILAAIVAEEGASGTRVPSEGRPWFEDIRDAMDKARRKAFGESSRRAHVVKELQQLIGTIARGERTRLPTDKKRQAKKFFRILSTQLHTT